MLTSGRALYVLFLLPGTCAIPLEFCFAHLCTAAGVVPGKALEHP